jgi:exodeoxyribonuclease V beta subunit
VGVGVGANASAGAGVGVGVVSPSVLYLVGDPKQSIYRFRGADVHTYLRARAAIVDAGGQPVALDRNHRATAVMVDGLNAIFDQQAPEPVFSGNIAYTPVTCGRPERALVDGDGHAVTPVYTMRFQSPGESVPLPLLGSLIAREVRSITAPDRPWRLDGEALAYSDVFVLTRNAREGRALGAALREGGVPYAFYKEDGLFRTDEAKDVRALLVAIEDPSDRARRLAAWLTPFFGLPLVAVERARDLPTSHPFAARLFAWKALADERDFERLFERVVEESGIVRREIFFGEGERELTNYLHILELCLEHARRTHATLRDLVHLLSGLIDGTRLPLEIEGSVQRLESDRRAVQIMTIHKSKGLEAAVVFVAGGFSQPSPDAVRVYHGGARRLAWVGRIDDAEVDAVVKQEEREEEQRLMYVALTRAKGRLYLPCLVEDGVSGSGRRARGDAKTMRGPYRLVNRRVVELARSQPGWLTVEDVANAQAPARPSDETARAATWTPPAALLGGPEDAARYTALREGHAAAIVTSYTRMRGAAARPAWTLPDEERRAEKAAASFDEAATTLRSARASGVFLHEVLERVPIASFAAPGLATWRELPAVSALFDEALAVHRIDRAQREHAEALVWGAYTTPVALPGGARIAGIAAAARVAREMEFVFPLPEAGHPTLAEAARGPFAIGRGYVRGSLDLAFDHEGMTYFLDWKSDSLRSYAPDALGPHVREHYEEQVALYVLAIVKLLGVRSRDEYTARFGGLLYCFLRGFDAGGAGVWTARPTWDDVLGWENALRARRFAGGLA